MTPMLACMAICAAAATPLSTIVGGYQEGIRVLQHMLDSPDLAAGLRHETIETITKTEQGYRVTSRDCTVEVTVIRRKLDAQGRTGFALDIGPGQCT